MSEATMSGSDYAELGRLRAENARLAKLAKRLKSERAELAEGFETLEKQHNDFREGVESNPLKKRLDEALKEIRTAKHQAAFTKRAKDLRPEALEDAYRLSGYEPDADEIDEAKLDEAIGRLREGKPYLFGEAKPAEGEKPAEKKPAGPGPGANRGGADRPDAARFTAEQLQDPSFMTRNAAAVSKHFAERNAAAVA